MFRVISQIMRASGRPPYSHRDPSRRPSRGGDRLDLSAGGLAHRLMNLRGQPRPAPRRRAPGPRGPCRGRCRTRSLPRPAMAPIRPCPARTGSRPGRCRAGSCRRGRCSAAPPPQRLPRSPHGNPGTSRLRPFRHVCTGPFLRARRAPRRAAFESRIDARASGPGVLVRTPRRPAAIAPEGAAMPAVHALQQGLAQAMPQLNPEPAVRFTAPPIRS